MVLNKLKFVLPMKRRRLIVVFFVFVEKVEIQANADEIVNGQNPVRDRKNPVSDLITVDCKPDRSQKLTDKKPM